MLRARAWPVCDHVRYPNKELEGTVLSIEGWRPELAAAGQVLGTGRPHGATEKELHAKDLEAISLPNRENRSLAHSRNYPRNKMVSAKKREGRGIRRGHIQHSRRTGAAAECLIRTSVAATRAPNHARSNQQRPPGHQQQSSLPRP